jgi:hypothetical protein
MKARESIERELRVILLLVVGPTPIFFLGRRRGAVEGRVRRNWAAALEQARLSLEMYLAA